MKNLILSFLTIFAFFPPAEARELELFKDKICLPFGSKELSQIGAEDMSLQYTTKKEFRFGLATIPPGCEVGFQTTDEYSSSEPVEYMESIRTIDYIRCPTDFKLADQLVSFASFDMQGCLEDPLFLANDVELCGRTYKALESIPIQNGKVTCPKLSKLPKNPKSDSKQK